MLMYLDVKLLINFHTLLLADLAARGGHRIGFGSIRSNINIFGLTAESDWIEILQSDQI